VLVIAALAKVGIYKTVQNSYTFKMRALPLFVCISIIATLIFTGFIVVENDASINWNAYVVALVSVVVFSMAWSFFMVLYYKTTLKNEGVKSFNFWGKSRFVEWENISKVKPVNFLGLKYLRVFTGNSGLALWVPLFIKNIESFAKQASTLPPEGNVFREYYTKQYG